MTEGGRRKSRPEKAKWGGHTCSACGKQCFPSRALARRAGRSVWAGETISAYQCGEVWHYGHTPVRIRRNGRG